MDFVASRYYWSILYPYLLVARLIRNVIYRSTIFTTSPPVMTCLWLLLQTPWLPQALLTYDTLDLFGSLGFISIIWGISPPGPTQIHFVINGTPTIIVLHEADVYYAPKWIPICFAPRWMIIYYDPRGGCVLHMLLAPDPYLFFKVDISLLCLKRRDAYFLCPRNGSLFITLCKTNPYLLLWSSKQILIHWLRG